MRKTALALVAILLSAVMFVLALPPADLYPFGFLCFVPVLAFVRGRGFALGFACGMAVLIVAALVAWSGVFYKKTLVDVGPQWLFAGFALFGLVVAGVCGVVGETKRQSNWFPWAVAALAVLLEALLLVYLPAHLALTQYRSFAAMKLASVTGVWGVSFLLWSIQLLLVTAARDRSRKVLLAIGAFLGLYIGVTTFTGRPQGGDLTVGLIQTETQDIGDLARLNGEATQKGASIVVWPELSAYAAKRTGDEALHQSTVQKGQSPFVTTYEEPADFYPYNTAIVVTDRGELGGYRKRKLFAGEKSERTPGNSPAAVEVGGITYGLNICFDSCFPSVMRETALLPGVDVILLPTLDPMGTYGTIQAMHAAYTPFRSAELGVAIVRADVTAHSMVVDSRGVIVAEAGAGTVEVLTAQIEPRPRATLFRTLGDWFVYLSALLAVVGYVRRGSNVRTPVDSE